MDDITLGVGGGIRAQGAARSGWETEEARVT